jgi:hypothetical protein
MKRSCILVLFVFFITVGNSFALEFNQIELVSSNWGRTNWNLSTDVFLQHGNDPAVSYYVNDTGPYPMLLTSVFGGAFRFYLDDVSARFPGSVPSDFNGDTFQWVASEQDESLSAMGVASGIRQVPVSTNILITGDPEHPTISWTNVDTSLDDYNIRLFDGTGTLLQQWPVPFSLEPFFTFSDVTLQSGANYRIRVEARDFEYFQLYDDDENELALNARVLNRSNAEIPYWYGPEDMAMSVVLASPADLVLYDSQGRECREAYCEDIPGATFERSASGTQTIYLPQVTPGQYRLLFIGTENGICHLSVNWHSNGDLINSIGKSFGITDGGYLQSSILISPLVGALTGVLMDPLPFIPVQIEVLPSDCPKYLNPKSRRGQLPVVVLGTETFDVTQLDPDSLYLHGVNQNGWSIEDVTGPQSCDASTIDYYKSPDGYLDLPIKFIRSSILDVIQDQYGDLEEATLTLTGNLKEEYGRIPIRGEATIIILKQ